MNANSLDEWRGEEAVRRIAGIIFEGEEDRIASIYCAYRKLVREDVQPEPEVDQDTLDTRELLVAWHFRRSHNFWDGDADDFARVKQALSLIKQRVRQEAWDDMRVANRGY